MKYMRGVYFVILVFATTIYGVSLKELLDEAVKNNLEIKSLRNKLEASKQELIEKGWFPDPSFALTLGKIPESNPSEINMLSLKISQKLPYFPKLKLIKEDARIKVNIINKILENKIIEIKSELKILYYELYFLYKKLDLKNQEKNLIQKFEKVAQVKYSLGKIPQHDVLKAQTELSLIADEIISIEEEKIPQLKLKINKLIGRDLSTPISKPEDFKIPSLKMKSEEYEKLALKNYPILKILKYNIEQAKIMKKLAKLDYVPDFNIAISRENMLSMKETNYALMFGINLPIWRKQKRAKINKTDFIIKSNELIYKDMVDKIRLKIQELLYRLKTTEREMKLYQTTIIPLSEQSLQTAIIAYETGQVDFLSLITSINKLIDANLKYEKLRTDFTKTIAKLEKIISVEFTN